MMKRLFLLGVVLLLTISQAVYGQIPKKITYQGVLKLASDVIAPDGDYNITFKIYNTTTGGDSLWSETQNVSVEGGILDVILGSVNSIDLAFDRTYWLGVTVESYPELTPRIELTTVPYSFYALVADTALTSRLADASVTESKLASASVSQAKLKTATGEISRFGDGWERFTLPGGEYGFYPQAKDDGGSGNIEIQCMIHSTSTPLGSSYASFIDIQGKNDGTIYIRQRYITASGKDHWIFILRNRISGRIISAWQAPDHPCYGSSGDESEIPHPFRSYDQNKHQVILIDNEVLCELRTKAGTNRNLLDVIMNDYEVEMDSNPLYTPREIIEIDEYGDRKGEVVTRIKTPEWTKIMLNKDEITLKRRLVKELPSYIQYKKLKLRAL